MNDTVLYTLSTGQNGSAFVHEGTYRLDELPSDLLTIAGYLAANPDVVDLCVTRADGSNTILRRKETSECSL